MSSRLKPPQLYDASARSSRSARSLIPKFSNLSRRSSSMDRLSGVRDLITPNQYRRNRSSSIESGRNMCTTPRGSNVFTPSRITPNMNRYSTDSLGSVSSRRSSASTGGSSMKSKGVWKDRRALIMDAFHKQDNIYKILNFMKVRSRKEMDYKRLKNPTIKDFVLAFQEIYRSLNPFFKDDIKDANKFASHQIPKILEALQCGLPIQASYYVTPTTPSSWPYMLEAMAWMIDTAMYVETSKFSETHSIAKQMFPVFQNGNQIQISFGFHLTAYKDSYMRGKDNIEDQEEEFKRSMYDSHMTESEESMEELERQRNELQSDVQHLQQHTEGLDRMHDVYTSINEDRCKLDTYCKRLKTSSENKQKSLDAVTEEIHELNVLISSLDSQKTALDIEISAQPMSIEEVRSVQQEIRETQREVAAIHSNLHQSQDTVDDILIKLAQQRDQLQLVVGEHNRLVSELEVSSTEADNQIIKSLMLKASVNKQALTYYKDTVKPNLHTLHVNIISRSQSLRQKIVNEELCSEKLEVEVADAVAKEGNFKRKLGRLQDEIEDIENKKKLEVSSLKDQIDKLKARVSGQVDEGAIHRKEMELQLINTKIVDLKSTYRTELEKQQKAFVRIDNWIKDMQDDIHKQLEDLAVVCENKLADVKKQNAAVVKLLSEE